MHHQRKHAFQIDSNQDREFEDFFEQFDEHVDPNRDEKSILIIEPFRNSSRATLLHKHRS